MDYVLTQKGNGTVLTIIQDNIPSEDAKKHTEHNWKLVMAGLKKLCEA